VRRGREGEKERRNSHLKLNVSLTRAPNISPNLAHDATTPSGQMTAAAPTYDPSESLHLLHLPAELRNRIYDFALSDDIEIFAETARLPSLLRANRQIHREYASVFYSTDRIKLDAYYQETDSWCEVAGWEGKQALLERSSTTFVDLLDFWSLASARRHCQRIGLNRENLQRGIVTVSTSTGFRRWQWNVQS